MNIIKYDIVIPIFNIEERGVDRLSRQLMSLYDDEYPWGGVLVVDGSPAPSEAAKKVCDGFCGARYINFPQDIFNKSVLINIGIRESKSEYTIISDLDSLYSPRFVRHVGEVFGRNPNAFITSISFYLPEDTDYTGCTEDAWWAKYRKMTGRGIDTACGGVQAAKRSWWYRVRGFDERYVKLGAMDGDTLKRAHADGLEVVWMDRLGGQKTTLFHQWHPVIKWKTDDDIGWLERNREVYYGDDTVNRNPRGWCGEGKIGVSSKLFGHDKVIDRALNIIGVVYGASPADIYVGEGIEGKLCINPRPVTPNRVGRAFETIFGYSLLLTRPQNASAVYCMYAFGEIVYCYRRGPRNMAMVGIRDILDRKEEAMCIEVCSRAGIDICEFVAFRVNKRLHLGNISLNPTIYPSGRSSTTAKREMFLAHRLVADKIEKRFLAGRVFKAEPPKFVDFPEKALKYLASIARGKDVLIYGENEVAFFLADICKSVDVVVGTPREAAWIEECKRAYPNANLNAITSVVRTEYDVVLIENLFGACQIAGATEVLKCGGVLALNNYKWFWLSGKYEFEPEIRRRIFAWQGITFNSDKNDGGGVAFKIKKR